MDPNGPKRPQLVNWKNLKLQSASAYEVLFVIFVEKSLTQYFNKGVYFEYFIKGVKIDNSRDFRVAKNYI